MTQHIMKFPNSFLLRISSSNYSIPSHFLISQGCSRNLPTRILPKELACRREHQRVYQRRGVMIWWLLLAEYWWVGKDAETRLYCAIYTRNWIDGENMSSDQQGINDMPLFYSCKELISVVSRAMSETEWVLDNNYVCIKLNLPGWYTLLICLDVCSCQVSLVSPIWMILFLS